MLRLLNRLSFLLIAIVISWGYLVPHLSAQTNDTTLIKVFPEGLPANAAYLDDVWQYSNTEQIILTGVHFATINNTFLLVKQGDVKKIISLNLQNINKYTFINPTMLIVSDVNVRKLVYALNNDTLGSFNLNFNSSLGFVVDDVGKVAYYHIAKIERDEFSTIIYYQYRINLYNPETNKVQVLAAVINTNNAIKSLNWLNKQIVVEFSNAEKKFISIN